MFVLPSPLCLLGWLFSVFWRGNLSISHFRNTIITGYLRQQVHMTWKMEAWLCFGGKQVKWRKMGAACNLSHQNTTADFAVIQDQHYALGYQKTFVFIIIYLSSYLKVATNPCFRLDVFGLHSIIHPSFFLPSHLILHSASEAPGLATVPCILIT